jgi:hypothetical protein
MREDTLYDVHKALSQASVVSAPEQALDMITTSARVDRQLKAEVDEICRRNGTTFSEWVRQCCIGLVKDYRFTPEDSDESARSA